MVKTNSFIETSLKELQSIKEKQALVELMAKMALESGLWHALGGIRNEGARLNELRKAYYFYE
ncbi:gp120 [Bacillus phage W.Ph.]|uniref:Gp120 n=1 Tax=Bacillus phage W.Ph. TaxID=764595 RepID=G9B1M1_9CAUD|nr:gp120 [Bacillus phage W.Ph.]ADH03266.1 gp120 [Bacillus phage W.Ph.]